MSVLNGDLTNNISNGFIESACWADDLIDYGHSKFTFNWHFIDRPYNADGFLQIPLPHAENGVYALEQAVYTLKSFNYTVAPYETSTMLRYLIHIVGDLHQPLHSMSRYTEKYPNGDEGGNLVPINYLYGIDNLHKLWDSAVGLFH